MVDLLAALFLLRFARLPVRFFGPIGGLVAELIVFIHARRLRDYRIGGEWKGAAEEAWAESQADPSSRRRHAAGPAE